jgi:hypothetical protein
VKDVSHVAVAVTLHARLRGSERSDELASLDADQQNAAIRADVYGALANGRISCHEPRWAHYHPSFQTLRRNRREHVRYVWPADESRCYVVKRISSRPETWLVVTVFARAERATA